MGPDGQVVFDLIAEVTQVRTVRGRGSAGRSEFIGGATIVIGPDGGIRYVVAKSVLNEERLARQRRFQSSARGREFWKANDGMLVSVRQPLRALHARRRTGRAEDPVG